MSQAKSYSVIIPAFNEERSIARVVEDALGLPLHKEVIVVDDGSTDRTPEYLETMRHRPGLKLMRNPGNAGKGFSVRRALGVARGSHVVLQDADTEYPVHNVPLMARHLGPGVDMVVGVRRLSSSTLAELSVASLIANKLFIRLLRDPDPFSGQRIVRRELLTSIPMRANGFEIETELTLAAGRRRWHVCHVPVDYRPRSRQQGKKIGWRDLLAISKTYLVSAGRSSTA